MSSLLIVDIKSTEEFVIKSKNLVKSLGFETIEIDKEEDEKLVNEIEEGFNNFMEEVFGSNKEEKEVKEKIENEEKIEKKEKKEEENIINNNENKKLTFDDKINILKDLAKNIINKF